MLNNEDALMRRLSVIFVLAMLVPFVSLSLAVSIPSVRIHAQTTNHIVRFVDWNMNGSRLAVGFQSSRLEVFDVDTGQSLLERSVTGSITSLQWSPTAPFSLAVGIVDMLNSTGSVEILDISTGEIQWLFDAGKPVNSVTWSPDGARIAAACNELFDSPIDFNEIKIWDSRTGEQTGSIPPDYPSYMNAIAWSPGSDQIAGGSGDGRVFVWDADSGTQIAEMTGHTSAILGVVWAPDNQRLVSISFSPDNTLRLWDAFTGLQLQKLMLDYPRDLDWNKSGNELAVRESFAVRVLDAVTNQVILEVADAGPSTGVSFSPFGARLAYGGSVPPETMLQGDTVIGPSASSLAHGQVQIVVPNPSAAGLEAVATACNAPPAVVSALTEAAQSDQFESMGALVELLDVEELPPGCAGDMLAVIDAMAAQ